MVHHVCFLCMRHVALNVASVRWMRIAWDPEVALYIDARSTAWGVCIVVHVAQGKAVPVIGSCAIKECLSAPGVAGLVAETNMRV
jgi:hypothetical protein